MTNLYDARASNGRFSKEKSGNPGGRLRDEQKVAELARSYTREAIEKLAELMSSSKDERVRGTAAQALLERGWGKPKGEVVADGAGSYIEALRLINEQIEADQTVP